MKRKEKSEVTILKFPSAEEIKAAQLACCGRCCTQCESPAAYAWRKREVDMAFLLEKAIRSELTETERVTVIDHWFNYETVTQIAEKREINASAVNRTLARAKDKLERVLKYAVCYQQNISKESIIPIALGRARVIAAARNAVGGNSGDRIIRLRQSQNLTQEILASALCLSVDRLSKLENGAEPSGSEVTALSEFFDVTSDFILKGESNDN